MKISFRLHLILNIYTLIQDNYYMIFLTTSLPISGSDVVVTTSYKIVFMPNLYSIMLTVTEAATILIVLPFNLSDFNVRFFRS